VFKVTEEMFSYYPEYERPKVSDFKWGVLAALVIHILKKLSVPAFYPFYYRVID
jgi:hypothetical protein